jgi:hypothetical protein
MPTGQWAAVRSRRGKEGRRGIPRVLPELPLERARMGTRG